MLRSVVVLRCKCLPLLRLAGLRVLKVVRPNNSFKPNLLRYSNNMAGKACHVLASTTQVGLIQALGLMSKLSKVVILFVAFVVGVACSILFAIGYVAATYRCTPTILEPCDAGAYVGMSLALLLSPIFGGLFVHGAHRWLVRRSGSGHEA